MIAKALKGALEGLLAGLANIWSRVWDYREEKKNELIRAELEGLKAGNRALRYKLRARQQLRKEADGGSIPPGDSES